MSVGTVTAQLLYEIGGPLYANTDVVADFSTIDLERGGPRPGADLGGPGPARAREAQGVLNLLGGWRNTMTFVLTGLDIEEKADLVRAHPGATLVGGARPLRRLRRPADPHRQARRADQRAGQRPAAGHGQGPRRRAGGPALLRAPPPSWPWPSYPGLLPDRRRPATAPPTASSGRPWCRPDWSSTRPSSTHDGRRVAVAPPPAHRDADGAADAGRSAPRGRRTPPAPPPAPPRGGRRRRLPLGTVIGARSGDKGGNANVGLWARVGEAWAWLRRRAHRRAVPPAAARGRRPRGRPLRAPQPAGPQLRGPRPPGRGRGLVHPPRPPGQEPGRVPALPAGRRPGRRSSADHRRADDPR